ncbi:MAG: FAD:protein FMN transferase [Actinomycetes bacterium]
MTDLPTKRARVRAEIETWGTILYLDVASESVGESELNVGIEECRKYFYFIDDVFSTYKAESEVSRLRAGKLNLSDSHPDLREVWAACEYAKEVSDGFFDPWCVEGGFDPSGYVKGWAADKAIAILKSHGAQNIQINCAGDLSLAGGFENGKPWNIGIRHPEEKHTIVKVFDIMDGAIATSGTYERGAHIRDPHTGLIALGARSATVYGPDGGLADALATALVVAGRDGAYLFMKPELAEYNCWVIDRHGDQAWSPR